MHREREGEKKRERKRRISERKEVGGKGGLGPSSAVTF